MGIAVIYWTGSRLINCKGFDVSIRRKFVAGNLLVKNMFESENQANAHCCA